MDVFRPQHACKRDVFDTSSLEETSDAATGSNNNALLPCSHNLESWFLINLANILILC